MPLRVYSSYATCLLNLLFGHGYESSVFLSNISIILSDYIGVTSQKRVTAKKTLNPISSLLYLEYNKLPISSISLNIINMLQIYRVHWM
jgi:hypothetical protein